MRRSIGCGQQPTKSKAAIVTLGSEGLVAFGKQPGAEGNPRVWRSRLDGEHVPALTNAAIDTLGCGDALLSAAVLSLCCEGTLGLSAVLGGVAAATQVRKLGNAVVGAEDLRRGVRKLSGATLAMQREPHAKLVV